MREFTGTDDEFLHDDGSVVRREWGTQTENGLTINGEWVLRGSDGVMVDFHQYRTDLESRNKIALVEVPKAPAP